MLMTTPRPAEIEEIRRGIQILQDLALHGPLIEQVTGASCHKHIIHEITRIEGVLLDVEAELELLRLLARRNSPRARLRARSITSKGETQ